MSNSIVLRKDGKKNDGRKDEKCAIRWVGAFAALLAVLCYSAPAALGQCSLAGADTWNVAGNGNWNAGADWTSGEPNSAATNVCITNGTSAVTLNTDATVADLQLGSGNTLNLGLNTQLGVAGNQIINAGNIAVNGGSGSNTFLFIENNVTLSGGGTLTLSTASGGGDATLEESGGSFTLTNQSTIQGNGIIGNNGLSLNNSGTVDANVSGQVLTLSSMTSGATNTGLLEATNGGVLNIDGITVNNASGNITANGGTVQLFGNTTIQGGTLNTLNGGVLGTPNGNVANLDGSTVAGAVTINGTYTAGLGSETVVRGTITNNGNIQVNGGSGSNTLVLFNGDTTLSGGTLTLSTAGGGGDAILEESGGSFTLTNQSTIQGNGIIGNNGLSLNNPGTVDANSSGQTLELVSMTSGTTNTGLLEATSGGVLNIDGITVNNASGNITANGGTVQLFGGTVIQGGTLNNNGGTLGTPAGNAATLDGSSAPGAVTINGTYLSAVGSVTTLLGTINNKNNIQLNAGGGSNSELLMGGGAGSNTAVTLQGGGTVNLFTTTGGGNAIIEQSIGGVTLTNVNNTIQGEGIIGNNALALVNQATIDANSSGAAGVTTALLVDGLTGALTNTGLLEATNSGVLNLDGITVNNTGGGKITATGASATVQLFGGTVIEGGTLTNNGGTLGTPAGNSAFLDGSTGAGAVTLNGTYLSDLGSVTTLLGTINNNNNIQLNGGSGHNSELLMGTTGVNVTLQGGGTVNLSTATGGGFAFIEQSTGGVTLTNVNNIIQGEGIIGNNGLTLVNQATIDANSSGAAGITTPLLLDGLTAVTNTGLLEATNKGVLQLDGITVNNAGANITASGANATVQLFGSATIEGGTLNNNGGTLGTPSGFVATLDGTTQGPLTINGTYLSDLNTDTHLLGTINNNNNFQLNGGSGTNSFLFIDNNVTLQGGGTVTMSTAGGGGDAWIVQNTGGLTLTNVNNTIQGSGIIGDNGLTLLNQAGGIVIANGTPTSVLEFVGGAVTNQGLMEATGSGVLQVDADTINNAGGVIKANGGIRSPA